MRHTLALIAISLLTAPISACTPDRAGSDRAEVVEVEPTANAAVNAEAAAEQAQAEAQRAAQIAAAQAAAARRAAPQEDTTPDPNAPSDVAAPPANAERTESGLASVVLQAGSGGERPAARDTVSVHYTGWQTNGHKFDSSVDRGEPASFPLNRVIAGWTEGLQLMQVGEKRRLWIPEPLAYGGRPGRPSGMLVFDVELLSIQRAPEAPPAEPPANAERTESGIASVVLQRGTGSDHPTATSRVQVHYTGWTTDGNMFDSSVQRGSPATFPLNGVIPGWTEGVQLMVVGEKRRFWIPANLAYEGRRGPQGTLIFDVELLAIQ